jgi:cytochrome c oxidase assembly factor CtaG
VERGVMTMRILMAWDPDISVIIGCAALALLYALACKRDFSRVAYFILGDLIMLLALISPLDVLADDYLFSAHMLQHMLLVLATPPLLILGLPRGFAMAIVRVPTLRAVERALRNPAAAWILGMVALWIWHLPRLYDATLASEPLHIFEHLTFLVTATIFWWPILAPLETSRMSHGAAFAYLGAAMLATTILGILITFAPVGVYKAYLHPEDSLHILGALRDSWGLTTQSDQELGGLLMWVPGGLVYLGAIMAVLARWYRAPLDEHQRKQLAEAGVSHA